MSGPYFLDKLRSGRCGKLPSLCIWPMIGSFGGEGGRFLLPVFAAKNCFNTKMVMIKGMRKITRGCNHTDDFIVGGRSSAT